MASVAPILFYACLMLAFLCAIYGLVTASRAKRSVLLIVSDVAALLIFAYFGSLLLTAINSFNDWPSRF
jgi:hypothetical protein